MSSTISTKKALQKFHVTPEDIIMRMREYWLDDIDEGGSSVTEKVLPYLEIEAIARLKQEIDTGGQEPKLKDGFEEYHSFWVNEALHNKSEHYVAGTFNDHLSYIGRCAANIILTSSELRDAIHYGKSEKAAALGMLLIAEVMHGGYFGEYNSLKSSKENSYEKGIGKESVDYEELKKFSVLLAKKYWGKYPELRIGEVSKNILQKIKENKEHFKLLEAMPKENTIKTWLKNASKSGKLAIPEGAQRHGRQAKNLA